MAGTIAPGELAARLDGGVRYVLAEPCHDAAIRDLLRESPVAGTIAVSFEHEPSFFAEHGMAEAHDITMLAFAAERLVCMGRCTIRPGWVGDRIVPVGYLRELRLAREAQGRFDILRGGYQCFAALRPTLPATFFFTSIASDNRRARRFLERGVPGLPRYRFIGDFVTRMIPVRPGRTRRLRDAYRYEQGSPARWEEIAGLLNRHARRQSLATAWTANRLRELSRHGLESEDFHLLYAGDQLIACAALWDQRRFRQVVIREYAPWLRRLRPLLNAIGPFGGQIPLPPVGAVVPLAYASPLATEVGHDRSVVDLLEAMNEPARARGLQLLTVGFAAEDARLNALRDQRGGREYATRLYQVRWPTDAADDCVPPEARCMPDIAFL